MQNEHTKKNERIMYYTELTKLIKSYCDTKKDSEELSFVKKIIDFYESCTIKGLDRYRISDKIEDNMKIINSEELELIKNQNKDNYNKKERIEEMSEKLKEIFQENDMLEKEQKEDEIYQQKIVPNSEYDDEEIDEKIDHILNEPESEKIKVMKELFDKGLISKQCILEESNCKNHRSIKEKEEMIDNLKALKNTETKDKTLEYLKLDLWLSKKLSEKDFDEYINKKRPNIKELGVKKIQM